jgi:carbonic anhydrase
VHKSAAGALAVLGVLIEEGAENPAFATVWGYLPTAANRERTAPTVVDPSTLLPADRSYYRYMGSLTTPPCTEGVHWLVLRAPVALSAAQIAKYRSVIRDNNRPVQPLNRRRIAG